MVPRENRAFTLIELLAVIAIIGVLASLVLPALSFAKFQGRNTICRNNLRQIGLGLEIYTATFDAYPPYASPVNGEPEDTWYRWDMLLVHLGSPTRNVLPFSKKGTRVPALSILCPLLIGPRENLLNPFGPAWDSAYRYNSTGVSPLASRLGLGGVPIEFPLFAATRQSTVVSPSEMVALGDPLTRSPDPKRDGSYDATTARFRPQPRGGGDVMVMDAKKVTVFKNHRNRYNRIFCDGHVELEDFSKRFVDSDSYLAQYNVDHQPHRELWQP